MNKLQTRASGAWPESRAALAARIGAFYERSPNAAYTNAALGAIALAAMWHSAPRAGLLAWFCGVLAINAASLALHYEIGRAHV